MTISRVLIATPLYPPDAGGPATYARLLETELPQKGIAVTVVRFGDVRHMPKVFRHIAYTWMVLRAARNVNSILALDPVSVGLPALVAARLSRTRFLVKVVGDYAWEQGTQRFGITASLDTFVRTKHVPVLVSILRMIQRAVVARAESIIVPSNYLKGIVRAWGIPEERIQVIYNAISLGEMGAVPKTLSNTAHPLIVTVGRLVPWKHVDAVIDAVEQMRAEGRQAHLRVVGTGPLTAPLHAHAATTSLGEEIFLGPLTHADTLAVLAASDVFVLNSSYEGLSHVLIEALMLGKVIVATDAGGNGELITDMENGVLVPVGDTVRLREALVRVCGDEALRARLQEGTRASESMFSVERMVSRTVEVLTA